VVSDTLLHLAGRSEGIRARSGPRQARRWHCNAPRLRIVWTSDRTQSHPRRSADQLGPHIQVINPAKINEIMSPTEECNDVWARLIERGELLASRVNPTSWFSVDTVLQLEALNQSR